MFQSVRHWWTGGRGKITLRLFVFEFVVVMAGVLAAQWLQQRQQDLSLQREARALINDNYDAYALILGQIEYWHNHASCVADRANLVARTAGEGRTMTRSEIGRPAIPGARSIDWTPALLAASRIDIGPEKFEAYRYLDRNNQLMDETGSKIADDWAIFALLDPSNGPPSPQDLANVRLAAIRVGNNLRLLQYKYGESRPYAELLGIRPMPVISETQIDKCGMIPNWG